MKQLGDLENMQTFGQNWAFSELNFEKLGLKVGIFTFSVFLAHDSHFNPYSNV